MCGCQSKKVCSCDFYHRFTCNGHMLHLFDLIFITRPKSDSFLPALDLSISILVLNVASRSVFRVYSDGLELGIWFTTFCCCLVLPFVEFGSSCFNHALIKSWFVWFGPWYTTHPPSFSEVFSWRHRRALEKQKQKKQTKHSKQQDNTSMTVTLLVQGISLFGLFNLANYCSKLV